MTKRMLVKNFLNVGKAVCDILYMKQYRLYSRDITHTDHQFRSIIDVENSFKTVTDCY